MVPSNESTAYQSDRGVALRRKQEPVFCRMPYVRLGDPHTIHRRQNFIVALMADAAACSLVIHPAFSGAGSERDDLVDPVQLGVFERMIAVNAGHLFQKEFNDAGRFGLHVFRQMIHGAAHVLLIDPTGQNQ